MTTQSTLGSSVARRGSRMSAFGGPAFLRLPLDEHLQERNPSATTVDRAALLTARHGLADERYAIRV